MLGNGIDATPIQTYLNAVSRSLFNTVEIILKTVMILLKKAANYG